MVISQLFYKNINIIQHYFLQYIVNLPNVMKKVLFNIPLLLSMSILLFENIFELLQGLCTI